MARVTHDPLTLLLHVGDAFAVMFRHGPRYEARLTAESWFVSAGATHCIWNWVGLTTASLDSLATLREATTKIRELGLTGLVCYPPDLAPELAKTFQELGLDEPGPVPLMVLDPADLPPLASTPVTVERLTGSDALAQAVAIAAASFEMPLDETTAAFNADLLAEPAVLAYVARRPDAADPTTAGRVAGFLAGTRLGDTLSIDIMAVDPARQRQGIGRALMLAALHEQIAAGVSSFHLLASDAGVGLYEQVGFTTLLTILTRFIPIDPIPPDQVVL